MSDVIRALPDVKKVDRDLAAVSKELDAVVGRVVRAKAEHAAAEAEWSARGHAAFAGGSEFDEPKPVLSAATDLAEQHLKGLRHRREALLGDRARAIVANGAAVLEAAAKRTDAAVVKAAPLLAELDECLEVLGDARSDVHAVVDAANAVSLKGRISAPDLAPLDLAALKRAVAGEDPIGLDKTHAKKVLGFQKDEPDATFPTAPVPGSPESVEAARVRNAALAAQARGLRHEPPFAFRGGVTDLT